MKGYGNIRRTLINWKLAIANSEGGEGEEGEEGEEKTFCF